MKSAIIDLSFQRSWDLGSSFGKGAVGKVTKGHRRSLIRMIVGVLVGFASLDLSAQLNLTAGYDALYGGTDNLNEILETFNREVDGADINPIRLQHGFSIGARYQLPVVTFNFTFTQTFNRRSADDLIFRGSETDLVFSHGLAGYMAGIEIGNAFFAGASINYHRLRYSADFSGQKETVVRENSLGNRFYIGLQSRGDSDISIAIKPYIQVLWSDIDIREIETAFDPGAGNTCFYCTEKKPFYLGISITLQNGRHR